MCLLEQDLCLVAPEGVEVRDPGLDSRGVPVPGSAPGVADDRAGGPEDGRRPRSGRRRAGAGRQRRGDGRTRRSSGCSTPGSRCATTERGGCRATCWRPSIGVVPGGPAALVERQATLTLVNRASRPAPRPRLLAALSAAREGAHSARDFFLPGRPVVRAAGETAGGPGQGFRSPPCAARGPGSPEVVVAARPAGSCSQPAGAALTLREAVLCRSHALGVAAVERFQERRLGAVDGIRPAFPFRRSGTSIRLGVSGAGHWCPRVNHSPARRGGLLRGGDAPASHSSVGASKAL